MSSSFRRRIRWSVIGFLAAFALTVALVLADGLAIGHFEALYQGPRPVSVLEWFEFALRFLDPYIIAGLVGGLLGFVGSFARPVKSRKRVAGWFLILCGLLMATTTFGSGRFLEFLDSGEGTAPASDKEMAPIYALEFLIIAGGATLVRMGGRPKAT